MIIIWLIQFTEVKIPLPVPLGELLLPDDSLLPEEELTAEELAAKISVQKGNVRHNVL